MSTRIALSTLLLVVACGSDVAPPEPTATRLPPDSFRQVLVELAVARVSALPDTQAWRDQRAAILDRHGLESEDLGLFVDAYGRHDEVMEAVYRDLGAALDSIARARAEEGGGPAADGGAFPSAEEAARSAARAGEAVDTLAPAAGAAGRARAGEPAIPVDTLPGDTLPD